MDIDKQTASYLATLAAARRAGRSDPNSEAFGLNESTAENAQRLGANLGDVPGQLWPPVVYVLKVEKPGDHDWVTRFLEPDSILEPYTSDVRDARFWATEADAQAYVEEMNLSEPFVAEVEPAAHA